MVALPCLLCISSAFITRQMDPNGVPTVVLFVAHRFPDPVGFAFSACVGWEFPRFNTIQPVYNRFWGYSMYRCFVSCRSPESKEPPKVI